MRLIAHTIAVLCIHSSQAVAVGWYRAPCEDQQRKMEKALDRLEGCLEKSPYKRDDSKLEDQSNICKAETSDFNTAKEEYQKCRTEKDSIKKKKK